MAIGKSINKKSFYGGSETGTTPDIAMPPYDQESPITQAAPNPWDMQNREQQGVAQVPNELPEDVMQAMDQEESESSLEESEPILETNSQSKINKSPQESFKAIREAKERAERERDALFSQMVEMQNRMQSKQETSAPKQEPVYDDSDLSINEDDLVDGRYASKVANRIKNLESQLKNYQNQSHEAVVEARIRATFPDFESVVSKENVQMLNDQFPDIAKSLRDTQDIFSKASAAYTVIKKFGIHQESVYANDRAKAIINTQKPRPLASVSPQQGDSPLSKANAFANGMTSELKEQLRKEMYAARKAM